MLTERQAAIGLKVILLACAAGGVWWIVCAPAAPLPGASATAADVSSPTAAERGPQVILESAPMLREPPKTGFIDGISDPRLDEAKRREKGLRPVLDNLQGEPVYVEGIDGPKRR